MLLLDKTGKSLEVVLAAAVATSQLPVTVAYAEISQVNFAMLAAGANELNTNGISAVTVLGAPAINITRQLKHLSIVNVDTAAVTVTIRFNTSGVFYIWFKGTLAVGDQILYSDDVLQILDSSGRLKSGFSPVPTTVADGGNVTEGATTDLGAAFEMSASINARLRGLVQLMQKQNDLTETMLVELRIQTTLLQDIPLAFNALQLGVVLPGADNVELMRSDSHLLD